jgi:adenine deaminase
MYIAVKRLSELKGGMVSVMDGKVLAELALPLAGLVSDLSLSEVLIKLDKIEKSLIVMGCSLPEPFSVLSFLPLTPIPALRLTDKGLLILLLSLLLIFLKTENHAGSI